MSQLKPFKPGYYIWKYFPSKPAAAIFAILFLGISVLHLWRLCRRRAWFCIALTAGAIMECIGFGVRIKAHDDTSKLGIYIMQSAFILLAPILFSASIYMTLSRIIRSVPDGESCSVITPRKLTRFFVFGDILSLLIQGNSTPLNVVANGKYAKYGNWIVIAGLVLQVAMFGLFALTPMVFHRRYQRKSAYVSMDVIESYLGQPLWKQQIYMLYIVSLFIMIRSIYRVIEFSQGQDGYLISHEWTLYVFDATLMWVVTVVYFIWYPSQLSAAPFTTAQDNHDSMALRSLTPNHPKGGE